MKYSGAKNFVNSEHSAKTGNMCLHQEKVVIMVIMVISMMVTMTVMGTQMKFVLN
jgi:hypothetical protein